MQQIRLPAECNSADDGYTRDFTGSEFDRLRRFGKPELMKTNLKRVTRPTAVLHVANLPAGMSAADVRRHFEAQGGLQVSNVVAIEQTGELFGCFIRSSHHSMYAARLCKTQTVHVWD